jgi:carbonic anhydrase
MKIRVLIADDQALIRSGLRAIIESEPGMEVIGEAGDGAEAVEAVRRLCPDVALMDIRMPRLDGVAATRALIRGKPPAPKIAIVTCADPRLTSIEQMLGLAGADVDMIRNFGTVIDDDAVRSLVLSTRLLGTTEIMIINHTDCGMLRFTDSELEDRLRKETGRAPIAPAKFYSFTDATANTKEQIQKARSHPWISPEVPVRGFVYDVSTGRLSEVFPDRETVAG